MQVEMDPILHATVVLLSAALIISVVGNLLVIFSALMNRDLRNNTGLLIMNLSISDLCISCFSLPLRLFQILGFNWTDDFTSCGITVAFTIFFFTASNFNLFLVTLDRFLGVLWPIKYRIKISKRKINAAICCSWILACFIAFFPKFAVGEQQNANISTLKFICTFGTVLHPAYLTFMEIFTLFLPWSLMILMYSAILRTVFKSARGDTNTATKNLERRSKRKFIRNNERKAKEIKLAKGVFVIVIIYSVLMVPIAVIDLLDLIGKVQVPLSAIKITVLMAYLNPAVNPPVYAATSKKYKDTFARIFSCRRIIDYARGVFTNKVEILNDRFNIRNRKSPLGSSSVVPYTSSHINDSSSFSEAQLPDRISRLIYQKGNEGSGNSIVPMLTITEDAETNVAHPLAIERLPK